MAVAVAPADGLAGARVVSVDAPRGRFVFSYDAMLFDTGIAGAVRAYRRYNAAAASRFLLSWVVTALDGVGDDGLSVWQRLELLSDGDLGALLDGLAQDRPVRVSLRSSGGSPPARVLLLTEERYALHKAG